MSTQGWLVDRQARLRAFDRRHPWVMDTLVAVPIVLFSIPNLIEKPLSATIATLALLPPLYWRRRYPFPAFLVTATIELIEGLLGVGVGAGVILLVMLFGVASRGSWRALAWSSGITVALLVAEIYLFEPVIENRTITLFLVLGTSSGRGRVRRRGAHPPGVPHRPRGPRRPPGGRAGSAGSPRRRRGASPGGPRNARHRRPSRLGDRGPGRRRGRACDLAGRADRRTAAVDR